MATAIVAAATVVVVLVLPFVFLDELSFVHATAKTNRQGTANKTACFSVFFIKFVLVFKKWLSLAAKTTKRFFNCLNHIFTDEF